MVAAGRQQRQEARVHDGSGRIVVDGLTKRFGPVTAVSDLSFTVEPGSVTGFFGPNGSGKTTTLRMVLGLVRPDAGSATISGAPYERLGNPAQVVGAVLEAQSFHPARRAKAHLAAYAAAVGAPDERVEQVLELVGLREVADRPAGGYSMGMRQRLALATALLGDPHVLVLDEPSNGLDPEGIAWLRGFMQSFARSGRTVLMSSHLLAEAEQTVDRVLIVSRGQCVYGGQLDELRGAARSRVIVAPSDGTALVEALHRQGVYHIEPTGDGRLAISGLDRMQIAHIALEAGVALYDLTDDRVDLERIFLQLTTSQYAGTQYAGDQYSGGQYSGGQYSGGQYGGQGWR